MFHNVHEIYALSLDEAEYFAIHMFDVLAVCGSCNQSDRTKELTPVELRLTSLTQQWISLNNLKEADSILSFRIPKIQRTRSDNWLDSWLICTCDREISRSFSIFSVGVFTSPSYKSSLLRLYETHDETEKNIVKKNREEYLHGTYSIDVEATMDQAHRIQNLCDFTQDAVLVISVFFSKGKPILRVCDPNVSNLSDDVWKAEAIWSSMWFCYEFIFEDKEVLRRN